MIHIATVHYKSDKWIDIQLKYLKKYIKEPFRVYAVLNGISKRHFKKFYYAVDYKNRKYNLTPHYDHRDKLNFLSKKILEKAKDNDIIIFLDGDAFPIAPLDVFLKEKLKKYKIVAVKLVERSKKLPHPLFFAVKVGFWKSAEGMWGVKIIGESPNLPKKEIITKKFNPGKYNWYPLIRLNDYIFPFKSYGLYDNLIYHHGAGFRSSLKPYSAYPLSLKIYRKLKKDYGFYKTLDREIKEYNQKTNLVENVKGKKKPLYIFFHIQKCAGTTLEKHFRENLLNGQLLFLYKKHDPKLRNKNEIDKYLSLLPKEKKNRIKVIMGHEVYYGVHKFFPDREARYIVFLRNPIDRTISHYNYHRTNFHQRKKNKKNILSSLGPLSFNEWFLKRNQAMKNFLCKFLYCRDNRLSNPANSKVGISSFKQVKNLLDKFYFIGITEKPNDFLYIYGLFDMHKFFLDQNISVKYFSPKDNRKINSLIIKESSYDTQLYHYALELNKKFKFENKSFFEVVNALKVRRKISLSKYILSQKVYSFSRRLRYKSKFYEKSLALLKNSFKNEL